MEIYDRITASEFQRHMSRIEGFKISHVWLGYAQALFLECGRLTRDRLFEKKTGRRNPDGQITFMLEPSWRVEKTRSIDFASDFGERLVENRTRKLVGLRIVSICAIGRVPELSIELSDGRAITTFGAYQSSPVWSIGFKDLRYIDVDEVWKQNDVSAWLSYEGGYRRGYCFDEAEFSDPKYLKQRFGLIV